ncbi:class I SAM-dependent DNA methyltransferase [Falsibacillus albus]|uniref:Class I SAM-dependent methyltransferase n=1 Tax=Falsibacillus albus TaxID=2478915 RepID=A0A3L7K5A9_9BACI|nr:class I SAM-dependent methyltransferase [Falsibacillus albus]RLQ97469.1 class I SAM-dependent methyltransferase [Falsibacillus albus]
MEYKGSKVYDTEEFFDRYMNRRHRPESPNTLIENPVLFDLLGDINGEHILDLGCGDASLGLALLEKNCGFYTGVDGSANMCQKATQSLRGKNGEVIESSMEGFDFPPDSFDTVVSQLALHYIDDFASLAKQIYKTIKPNGRFVFSVQHPLLTASFKSMSETGRRLDWVVDDYFKSGKRTEPWIGEHVVKYHRTIEDYFIQLQQAGFQITDLKEAAPRREFFQDEEEYERRLRIPLFLLFSCRKSI